MAAKIGWCFPSSGGGVDGGFNHSGIEYYSGNPEYYLAREVIQNSLDARADSKKPVVVRFDLIDIPKFPGRDALLASFKACLKEEKGNEKAKVFFRRGIKILSEKGGIPCLRISDSNTTGLRGKEQRHGQWHNLTKAVGRSGSDKSDTSGGSYGIGKNAPFTLSALRTVFYSTSYKDGNARGFYHCAQGKSILTSHNSGGDELSQPDGFYGIVKGCRPIVGAQEIPDFLRRENEDGTTLVVAGFSGEEGWQDKIVAAVAGNFFYAINDRKLEVYVGDCAVRADTLSEIFDNDSLWGNLRDTDMEFAPKYYQAMQDGAPSETQNKTLGHVKLWVLVGDDLPKRTAIVRDTGMIITDKQPQFRFRGFNEYAALCVCEGQDANKILRGMENPEHDRFDPNRLKENKSEGIKVLKELREWVRSRLAEVAIPKETDETSLPELAEMFPDPDVANEIPGENDDRDIEGDQIILSRPRPARRKPRDTTLGPQDDDDPETPPVGPKRKRPARRRPGATNGAWEIADPRVVPDPQSPNDPQRKIVKFTPMVSGKAKVVISIAGDSFYEHVKTVDIGEVQEGIRKSVGMQFDRPVSDALIVSVFPMPKEEQ